MYDSLDNHRLSKIEPGRFFLFLSHFRFFTLDVFSFFSDDTQLQRVPAFPRSWISLKSTFSPNPHASIFSTFRHFRTVDVSFFDAGESLDIPFGLRSCSNYLDYQGFRQNHRFALGIDFSFLWNLFDPVGHVGGKTARSSRSGAFA